MLRPTHKGKASRYRRSLASARNETMAGWLAYRVIRCVSILLGAGLTFQSHGLAPLL